MLSTRQLEDARCDYSRLCGLARANHKRRRLLTAAGTASYESPPSARSDTNLTHLASRPELRESCPERLVMLYCFEENIKVGYYIIHRT